MHTETARTTRELLTALDDLRSRASLTGLACEGLSAQAGRREDHTARQAADRAAQALRLIDSQLGGLAEVLELAVVEGALSTDTVELPTVEGRRYTYLGTGRRGAPV